MGEKMPKIMLIEDDVTMVSLLTTLLQMEGFQVIKLKGVNLDQILTHVRDELPDLALVDVNLRFVSGFDILKAIRQDDILKNMRVVMSSGADFSEKVKEEGGDDFLLKPYMPDDLIQRIHNALNRQDR
jgi:OmpR family two-component system response regulator YxdJ